MLKRLILKWLGVDRLILSLLAYTTALEERQYLLKNYVDAHNRITDNNFLALDRNMDNLGKVVTNVAKSVTDTIRPFPGQNRN